MTFVDIDVEHQTHFSILLLNLVFEKYLLASPPENQPVYQITKKKPPEVHWRQYQIFL